MFCLLSKKFWYIFFFYSSTTYVMVLREAFLMITQKMCFCGEIRKMWIPCLIWSYTEYGQISSGAKILFKIITSFIIISVDMCKSSWLHLFPVGTWHLYNVGSTSMQRHDVASTFRRRCINVMCPLGFVTVYNNNWHWNSEMEEYSPF